MVTDGANISPHDNAADKMDTTNNVLQQFWNITIEAKRVFR